MKKMAAYPSPSSGKILEETSLNIFSPPFLSKQTQSRPLSKISVWIWPICFSIWVYLKVMWKIGLNQSTTFQINPSFL